MLNKQANSKNSHQSTTPISHLSQDPYNIIHKHEENLSFLKNPISNISSNCEKSPKNLIHFTGKFAKKTNSQTAQNKLIQELYKGVESIQALPRPVTNKTLNEKNTMGFKDKIDESERLEDEDKKGRSGNCQICGINQVSHNDQVKKELQSGSPDLNGVNLDQNTTENPIKPIMNSPTSKHSRYLSAEFFTSRPEYTTTQAKGTSHHHEGADTYKEYQSHVESKLKDQLNTTQSSGEKSTIGYSSTSMTKELESLKLKKKNETKSIFNPNDLLYPRSNNDQKPISPRVLELKSDNVKIQEQKTPKQALLKGLLISHKDTYEYDEHNKQPPQSALLPQRIENPLGVKENKLMTSTKNEKVLSGNEAISPGKALRNLANSVMKIKGLDESSQSGKSQPKLVKQFGFVTPKQKKNNVVPALFGNEKEAVKYESMPNEKQGKNDNYALESKNQPKATNNGEQQVNNSPMLDTEGVLKDNIKTKSSTLLPPLSNQTLRQCQVKALVPNSADTSPYDVKTNYFFRDCGATTQDKEANSKNNTTSTRDNVISALDNTLSIGENTLSARDIVVSIKDNSASMTDNAASTRENATSTRDNTSSTKDSTGSTKDKTGNTKDNTASTRDNTANTRDNTAITRNNVVITRDKAASTRELPQANQQKTLLSMKSSSFKSPNPKQENLSKNLAMNDIVIENANENELWCGYSDRGLKTPSTQKNPNSLGSKLQSNQLSLSSKNNATSPKHVPYRKAASTKLYGFQSEYFSHKAQESALNKQNSTILKDTKNTRIGEDNVTKEVIKMIKHGDGGIGKAEVVKVVLDKGMDDQVRSKDEMASSTEFKVKNKEKKGESKHPKGLEEDFSQNEYEMLAMMMPLHKKSRSDIISLANTKREKNIQHVKQMSKNPLDTNQLLRKLPTKSFLRSNTSTVVLDNDTSSLCHIGIDPEPSSSDTTKVDIDDLNKAHAYASDDSKDDTLLRAKLIRMIKRSFKGYSATSTTDNSASKASNNTSVEYYRIIKMIGKGSFGKVYLGIHILTGKYVAIKLIEKQQMQTDDTIKLKILQEIMILKNIHHDHVIKLLEIFENQKYIFMVFEHASSGDLLKYVKKNGPLSELEAKKIFIQIVEGIKHCHSNNILHRDIKLDNVLIDMNNTIKICDFGISRYIQKGQIITEQCGTPAYLAPEVIKSQGYEGYYSDIWSMGILLYSMVIGDVPFKGNNIQELHESIMNGIFNIPNSLSETCKDLINNMLKTNPYCRIGIEEIQNHEWFEDIKSNNDIPKAYNSHHIINNTLNNNSNSSLSSQCDNTSKLPIMDYLVKKVELFGYPRNYILNCLNENNRIHATATYYLLYKQSLHNALSP